MTTILRAAPGFGYSDCERIVDTALAQPVLALTSMAYVAAGLAALVWAARVRTTLCAAAGVALVAVGAGSFAYHGPQPLWAGPAHDWPIVALAAVCAAGLVGSVSRREWSKWAAPAVIFAVGLAAYVAGRSGSPLCRPDSLWQFHGVWHLLSAIAALAAALAMARGPMRSAPRQGLTFDDQT